MKTVSSHQPSFLPWAGYWHKVLLSDLHVLSAGVQFDYGGYQNRTPFNGGWITVPVVDAKGKALRDVRFDGKGFAKVLRTLRQTFTAKRLPYRERAEFVIAGMESISHSEPWLTELNYAAFESIAHVLGWKGEVEMDNDHDTAPTKTERLVARIRRSAGTGPMIYLAGSGARLYLDREHIPPTMMVKVQRPRSGICPDTVLQLIASEADPAAIIRASCDMEPLFHEAPGGDRPA